jgi:hypothetical protein
MTNFQVHPHFGYLNSDVLLSNNCDYAFDVKDTSHGEVYHLSPKESISVRLTAGEHKLVAEIEDEKIETETVIVEDAIKLGGSKEKKTYVFEGTPWTLMVMLDRTYFINRDTKMQFVEHGLVPKSIKYLTPKYLLFTTENDNSVFSLENLSVVKTIGNSQLLFSNNQYSLFSSGEDLVLFRFVDGAGDQCITLKCDDYTIDKHKYVLFYHVKGEKRIWAKRLDKPETPTTAIGTEEDFQCFIGIRSAVCGKSPQSLSVVNLHSKDSTVLYGDAIPVTHVNGKQIWINNCVSSLTDTEIENGFTSSAELTVYERGSRWFFVKQVKHVLKNKKVITKTNTYSLHVLKDDKVYFESSQPLSVTKGITFDCVNNGSIKNLLIFPYSTDECVGSPLVSPRGYILLLKTNTSNSKVLFDPLTQKQYPCVSGDLFQKTGLIEQDRPDETEDALKHCFLDVETKRSFANKFYEELTCSGFYRLYGGAGDYVHSLDGHVHSMPCIKDRLVSISEECNYAIVRSEDGILLLKYDSEQKKWVGTALERMDIDESYYVKAVFCSDGESIIYQKKTGDKYYLRQIGSNEETEFDLQGSVVRRNFNGYLPYMDFDTHRRPVYVDPVTLTRIEAAAAGQFTYQSIDGTIKHVAHNVIKYYSNEKRQIVSKEEYNEYVLRYDYEILGELGGYKVYKTDGPRYETAKNNRIAYFRLNKQWLCEAIRSSSFFQTLSEDRCLKSFLDYGSVCEDVLFKLSFYVREKIGEELIDIQIPRALYFLNYVSYSYDNKYIIVSGRFPMNSRYKGLALVYDVDNRKTVYFSASTMAVWLGVFSKQGMAAYYDSTPNSYLSPNVINDASFIEIPGRSFLAFSPSGNLIALSRQGYIPYASGDPHWGHQPSRDVYVVKSSSPNNELAHYCDHGDQIEGTGGWDRTNSSVASASFSADDKKLMTVSKDGVVVVRNLHFEEADE